MAHCTRHCSTHFSNVTSFNPYNPARQALPSPSYGPGTRDPRYSNLQQSHTAGRASNPGNPDPAPTSTHCATIFDAHRRQRNTSEGPWTGVLCAAAERVPGAGKRCPPCRSERRGQRRDSSLLHVVLPHLCVPHQTPRNE